MTVASAETIERIEDAPIGRWVIWTGTGQPLLTRRLDERRYKAVMPFLYTHAVVWGFVQDWLTYEDRWCYGSAAAACIAADRWEGPDHGEPEGWHRHPRSGRRRPDGDPDQEYVNP